MSPPKGRSLGLDEIKPSSLTFNMQVPYRGLVEGRFWFEAEFATRSTMPCCVLCHFSGTKFVLTLKLTLCLGPK